MLGDVVFRGIFPSSILALLNLSVTAAMCCSQFGAIHPFVQLDLYARAWYTNLLL